MWQKICNAIYQATKWLAIALLACLVSVILLQVIFRYFFNNALPWPEEVGRYSFAWVTLLGVSLCMAEDGHLRLDILMQFISKKTGRRLMRFADIISLGFFLFFGWISIASVQTYYVQGTLATSMPLPLWIVWLSIPVGCLLTALQLIRNILAHQNQHSGV